MKRTRLLTSVLAIAIAFAAANPALGSRDPGPDCRFGPTPARVGLTGPGGQYSDGMNLYQYVQSSPVQRIDPSGLQVLEDHVSTAWGSASFVKHYYTGGGKAVTLNEIGHFYTFVNAPDVKRSVENFKSHVRMRIAMAVSNGFLKCKGGKPEADDYTMWGRDVDVTDVTAQIFSVGRSDLSREYECKLKIDKCDCDAVLSWGYSCTLFFEINDMFSDPLDIGIELWGRPYGITAQWNISMNSNYKIERPIRFVLPSTIAP